MERFQSGVTDNANLDWFLSALNLVVRAVAGITIEHHAVTGKGADVFLAGAGRNPAAQVEGGRAERRQPLAVEFAGEVEVSAGGNAALTGGMPNMLTGFQERAGLDSVTGLDVHVQDDPTAAFVAVSVQVLDDFAIAGARDQAIRDSRDPIIDFDAALG
ncbi:MAG TPA: hypothetical protein VHN12_14650, partial [Geobacteraceae bacterium]|nr:hypothetical protein [Geobacteraceae bacterium]